MLALSLLMPKNIFLEKWGCTREIYRMARIFDVEEYIILERLKNLGVKNER